MNEDVDRLEQEFRQRVVEEELSYKCRVTIELLSPGDDGYDEGGFQARHTDKRFLFVCAKHKTECSGPFQGGWVVCPVTGFDLIGPYEGSMKGSWNE